MSYIKLNENSIVDEHICCAISNNKKDLRVLTKKKWLSSAFNDGLTFLKLDERGKVFIEYIPAEKAWAPINADNYLYINCFWVSGKFVKQGHATNLLNLCLEDAKIQGKDGLVILSSSKKMPFLSDPVFLKKKGFKVADTAYPNYELLYYPLNNDAIIPQFKSSAKAGKIKEEGMVLYYSHQCPHTQMYADIIKEVALENGLELELRQFTTYQDAQKAFAPFTTYSFFDNGVLVTNEIFSKKKFEKYLENRLK